MHEFERTIIPAGRQAIRFGQKLFVEREIIVFIENAEPSREHPEYR